MNKIIIAFDGTNFPHAAFEFARQVNEKNYILLTGIFIPQTILADMWKRVYLAGDYAVPVVEQEDAEMVRLNIARFEKLCKDNKIDYRIHKDFFDIGLTALEKESSFADLLLLGSQEFYNNIGSNEVSMLIENILQDAHCPVLLVPKEFRSTDSVILTYNGSDESLYAIKQFIYLFPHLLTKEALLTFVAKNEADQIPRQKEVKELVKAHFNKVDLIKIVSKEKHNFSYWCSEHPGAIVVGGSYGRSGFSMLFKKSFLEEIITHHQLPVFIAHK